MKKFKTVIILLVWILLGSVSIAMAQETLSCDYSLGMSRKVKIVVAVSLRFEQTAMAYLKWENTEATGEHYLVRYKPVDGLASWQEVRVFAKELIIQDLMLDTAYYWEVQSVINDEVESSGTYFLSTFVQEEPIIVSAQLYHGLSSWFARKDLQPSFCGFVENIRAHPFEKLAFLQAYAFENVPLQQQPQLDDLRSWYPAALQGGDCLNLVSQKGESKKAHCKVIASARPKAISIPISNTTNSILPSPENPTQMEWAVSEDAKYIALRQDGKGKAADCSLANTPDQEVVLPARSTFTEVKYLQACLFDDSTAPEQNQRRIIMDYYYGNQLKVKAEKKNCVFARAAAAQAEDAALLIAINESRGSVSLHSIGHSLLGNNVETDWQPSNWFDANGLRKSLQTHLEASAKTQEILNEEQWLAFEKALKAKLLVAYRQEVLKEEESLVGDETCLLTGIDTLQLLPNEPLSLVLFSSHYLRIKGFGCYRAEASIRSDFYLQGIVENYAVKEERDDIPNENQGRAIRENILQIYPTTSTNQVTITLAALNSATATLRVYDVGGRVNYNKELANQQGQPVQLVIDVSNWQAGTYWVELWANGKRSTLPLVKV